MNILVTGFMPFHGENMNPAEEILSLLPDEIGAHPIHTLLLPTEFTRSGEILAREILERKPELVLSLGQAAGRAKISLERVAINIMDANFEDNAGKRPEGERIHEDGDVAYFSTLPLQKIRERILDTKIPCDISNSAGTFVCNRVMYELLYLNCRHGLDMMAGFIHLPYLPEQALLRENVASMSQKLMFKAVELTLLTMIDEWDQRS